MPGEQAIHLIYTYSESGNREETSDSPDGFTIINFIGNDCIVRQFVDELTRRASEVEILDIKLSLSGKRLSTADEARVLSILRMGLNRIEEFPHLQKISVIGGADLISTVAAKTFGEINRATSLKYVYSRSPDTPQCTVNYTVGSPENSSSTVEFRGPENEAGQFVNRLAVQAAELKELEIQAPAVREDKTTPIFQALEGGLRRIVRFPRWQKVSVTGDEKLIAVADETLGRNKQATSLTYEYSEQPYTPRRTANYTVGSLENSSSTVELKGPEDTANQFVTELTAQAAGLKELKIQAPAVRDNKTAPIFQTLENGLSRIAGFPRWQKVSVTGDEKLTTAVAAKTSIEIMKATRVSYLYSNDHASSVPQYTVNYTVGSPENSSSTVAFSGSEDAASAFVTKLTTEAVGLKELEIQAPAVRDNETAPIFQILGDGLSQIAGFPQWQKVSVTGDEKLTAAVAATTSIEIMKVTRVSYSYSEIHDFSVPQYTVNYTVGSPENSSSTVEFRGSEDAAGPFGARLIVEAAELKELEIQAPAIRDNETAPIFQALEDALNRIEGFPRLQKGSITGDAQLIAAVAAKIGQIRQATRLAYIHSPFPACVLNYCIEDSSEDSSSIVKFKGQKEIADQFAAVLHSTYQKLEILQIVLPVDENEVTSGLCSVFDHAKSPRQLPQLRKLIIAGSANLAQAVVSKTSERLDTFILESNGDEASAAEKLLDCFGFLNPTTLKVCMLDITGQFELISLMILRVAKQLTVLKCHITDGLMFGSKAEATITRFQNMQREIIDERSIETQPGESETAVEQQEVRSRLFSQLSFVILQNQSLSLPLAYELLNSLCSEISRYLDLYCLQLFSSQNDPVNENKFFDPLQKASGLKFSFLQGITVNGVSQSDFINEKLQEVQADSTRVRFKQARFFALEQAQQVRNISPDEKLELDNLTRNLSAQLNPEEGQQPPPNALQMVENARIIANLRPISTAQAETSNDRLRRVILNHGDRAVLQITSRSVGLLFPDAINLRLADDPKAQKEIGNFLGEYNGAITERNGRPPQP